MSKYDNKLCAGCKKFAPIESPYLGYGKCLVRDEVVGFISIVKTCLNKVSK